MPVDHESAGNPGERNCSILFAYPYSPLLLALQRDGLTNIAQHFTFLILRDSKHESI